MTTIRELSYLMSYLMSYLLKQSLVTCAWYV